MDAQSFLNNFGYIADAPGGVKWLRELIYHFAITGCLSQYKQGDSISSMIKDHSLKEKERYLKKNKVRSQKRKQVELSQTEIRIPKRWSLLSAGDLVHFINGRAFKSVDWKTSGLPIIRIQNLNNPDASFNYFQGEVSEKHRIANGDLLLSWSGTPGTSFGAFIWHGSEAVLNQHIFKVIIYSSLLNKEYLKMAINSRLGALIGSARGGVGLKHVTKGQTEALQIPLPPIEEQKRIVTKVDELMALCDKLEVQQQKRQRLFPVLSRTTHTRLVQSPIPANLKAIFDEIETVSPDDLRKTILSLAVQGKLIPQDSKDDSVDEMLTRILKERKELNLTKTSKRRVLRHEETLEYCIPKSWRWQPLSELLIFGPKNGYSPKAVKYKTLVRSLTLSATTTGRFLAEHSKYITDDISPDSDLWLRDGDILVQRGNTLEYVGVAAVYQGKSGQFIYPDLMMKIRISSEIDVRYIHLAMSSEISREYLRNRATGTSGTMPKINQATLKNLPIPLPPLAEQLRIVAKVEQLITLADQLQIQQNKKAKIAQAFAQSSVTAITGTQIKEQEKMKAPKTELVSKLQIGKKPKKADQAPLADFIAKHKGRLSAKALWQQSGLKIDAFYQQLKVEMANGWIIEPEKATMQEVGAK